MKFLEFLKGVLRNMFSSSTIETALHIQPAVSSKMKTALELWESMYVDESPWTANDNVTSLGLPAMIASEKARTATIEMEIKVTGENSKADFIKDCLAKLQKHLRENLECGIALGGFVIKPYIVKGIDDKYTIEFSYVKATDFYPLSFSTTGNVTEAAFIDRIISGDVVFSKVEYHKLEGNTLTVINKAFRATNRLNQTTAFSSGELGTEIYLTEVPEWSNITPQVTINNIDTLLFAYFKMPDKNTVDLNSPLGVSGYARAVNLIKDADEQYSNLLWEFEGGQLAIDVDRTALNPIYDNNGKQKEVLPKLQERLFRHSLDLGDDNTYEVFSPQLRDSNILNGLNAILTRIEDVCALSRGTLSETTVTEARTATELRILKQRTYSANSEIQTALQSTLETIIKIVDKYCDLYDIQVSGDYEVAFKWDDSIIVDKDAERQIDLLDINAGLMSKVEYRMKWFGETEKQAEEMVQKINDEKVELMTMQQEVMIQSSNNVADDTQKTIENANEKQAEADKNQRANESQKTTDIQPKNDDE